MPAQRNARRAARDYARQFGVPYTVARWREPASRYPGTDVVRDLPVITLTDGASYEPTTWFGHCWANDGEHVLIVTQQDHQPYEVFARAERAKELAVDARDQLAEPRHVAAYPSGGTLSVLEAPWVLARGEATWAQTAREVAAGRYTRVLTIGADHEALHMSSLGLADAVVSVRPLSVMQLDEDIPVLKDGEYTLVERQFGVHEVAARLFSSVRRAVPIQHLAGVVFTEVEGSTDLPGRTRMIFRLLEEAGLPVLATVGPYDRRNQDQLLAALTPVARRIGERLYGRTAVPQGAEVRTGGEG